jgi:lipoprotein-releasing system permease protein
LEKVLFGINFKFVYTVAVRYLLSSRVDRSASVVSFLAVFGIGLGVFALIIVMSVMNGFRSDLISSIVASSGELTISAPHPLREYRQLLSKIQSVPFVKSIKPIAFAYGIAEFGNNRKYVTIKGVEGSRFKLMKGNLDFLSGSSSVAISKSLAQSLHVDIGNNINLTDLESLVDEGCFSLKIFTIKAIFFDSLEDSALVLTSIEGANSLLAQSKGVSSFDLETIDPDRSEEFASYLKTFVLPKEYNICTWKQLNPDLLKALEIENVSMFIILSLIVLVAVSNALSSLVMTVEEKTHEIAILKTIGASRTEILLIFILNGLAIGMIGVISGSILAFSFILSVPFIKTLLLESGIRMFEGLWYFLDKMPISINSVEVCSIIALASILSFFATLYPAYKASSIEPALVLK